MDVSPDSVRNFFADLDPDVSIIQAITIPPLSRFEFSNKLQVEAVENRIKFEQPVEAEDHSMPDLVAGISQLYLSKMKYRIQAIGINFTFVKHNSDLSGLVREELGGSVSKINYETSARMRIPINVELTCDTIRWRVQIHVNFHFDNQGADLTAESEELLSKLSTFQTSFFHEAKELVDGIRLDNSQ